MQSNHDIKSESLISVIWGTRSLNMKKPLKARNTLDYDRTVYNDQFY